MTSDANIIPPICRPAVAMEPIGGDGLLARAPAKINLALRVGPVRDDGFHPLDSVVAKITLYDELEFRLRDDGAVNLACDNAEIGPAEDNLVVRAARLLQPSGGMGVDIALRKNIPAGAGLGGGSADAAVTLRVLNEMWDCRLGPAELAHLAAELGSDVPLTLGPPASRMRGRGEIIDPIQIRRFFALLVLPGVHCSTAAVYRSYDQAFKELGEPDLEAFASLPADEWTGAIENDLYAPARSVCGEIVEWAELVAQATGSSVHMTGSGSALFALAKDLDSAVALAGRLEGEAAERARIVSLNPW